MISGFFTTSSPKKKVGVLRFHTPPFNTMDKYACGVGRCIFVEDVLRLNRPTQKPYIEHMKIPFGSLFWLKYTFIKGSLVANFRYTNFWVA